MCDRCPYDCLFMALCDALAITNLTFTHPFTVYKMLLPILSHLMLSTTLCGGYSYHQLPFTDKQLRLREAR